MYSYDITIELVSSRNKLTVKIQISTAKNISLQKRLVYTMCKIFHKSPIKEIKNVQSGGINLKSCNCLALSKIIMNKKGGSALFISLTPLSNLYGKASALYPSS